MFMIKIDAMRSIITFLFVLFFLHSSAQMTIVKGGYRHKDDPWTEWQTLYSKDGLSISYRAKLCKYMDEHGCSQHFSKIQVKRTIPPSPLPGKQTIDNMGSAYADMYFRGRIVFHAEKTTCSGKPVLSKQDITINFTFTQSHDQEQVEDFDNNINVITSAEIDFDPFKKGPKGNKHPTMGVRG